MFQLINRKNSLEVRDDEGRVMGDIRFQLSHDSPHLSDLCLVDQRVHEKTDRFGDYTRYQYVYKDENELVSFSFILHCYDHQIHAFTDVDIQSERIFGRNVHLNSEESIKINVGQIGKADGMVAHYRHKDWWTRPHFIQDLSALPPRTQSLLWTNEESSYYLLPICDSIFKSEISGTGQGFDITVSSYDDGRNQYHTAVFVLGKGGNPFDLAEQVTNTVLDIQGKSRSIKEKRYPERLEYLGWCSWDAFYTKVNKNGIIDKMKELQEKQVPVKWVMIDDGWLKTRDQRLCTFEPDPEKFPNGFHDLTNLLKNTYGVKSIGVWHTLAGYWGGIDPDSSLAAEMASYLYRTNSQKLIPYPEKGKGFGFWDAWHSYLVGQGIDFVEVDGQSAINNFMMGHMAVGQSALESHKALEASVGIHFDHCMINCMGVAPENVWNRPISAVSRCSDDFVPSDEITFAEHALQNAYNSFYHGELYWGDWDMFWTNHKDAQRHALLRSVSGGPIYISDRVGDTVGRLIMPLIYNDGRIIRCDLPGKPTRDVLTRNPTKEDVPLKIWNYSRGAGILAAFNIQEDGHKVEGTISPSDIEKSSADEYYMYDYFKQKVDLLEMNEMRDFVLDEGEYSLYFFLPKTHTVTPIGLIDKYISPATFETHYTTKERMVIGSKEGGRFTFISETEPERVSVNGHKAEVHRLNKEQPLYVIDCSSIEKSILIEINL